MGEEKKEKSKDFDLLSFLMGAAVGTFLGASILYAANYILGPDVERVRRFEDKENIEKEIPNSSIRLYKKGKDQILVENPEKKGEYIPIAKYLDTINDKSEREVREAQIEQLVEWHE